MTLTADTPSDSLSILGGDGVVTSETANPDKVIIDLDLIALGGLEIVAGQKVAYKVDGTTVQINGTNQLEALNVVKYLNDLTDVTITSPSGDDVLVYGSGTWTNKTPSITGQTGNAVNTESARINLSSVPGTAASTSHSHALSIPISVSDPSHTHSSPQHGTSDSASTSVAVLTSVGAASGTTNAVTSVTASPVYPASDTHYHLVDTLGVTFT